MEDYQLRHDIDRLRRFLDELEILYNDKLGETDGRTLKDVFDMYYDQSEVESKSAVLKDSLKTLSESLVAFNQSLITFNGDTEALADDLTSLSTNLDNFLGDLSGLGESLELFDAQLNGGTVDGTTYTGFLSALNSLENYMYGKGETYNNQPCTYQNPSPTSLKGLLNGLGEELQNLDSGDTQLSLTLSALSNKLSGYSDTLASFKAEIENEVGSETYEALNNELIELAYEIATSNTAISNHQTAIQTVQGKIGSSDSTDTSTVFGKINGADSRIGAVENSATGLTKTLYAGTNGTGTTSSPATGTVMKNLNTVKNTDVPALQNQIHGGNPQNPTSTSVMGRIDTVQTGIAGLDDQINNEEDGLVPQIETVITNIGTVDNAINNSDTGLKKRADDLEDRADGLEDRADDLEDRADDLEDTVGDNTTGLVKQTNDNTDDISALGHSLGRFIQPKHTYPIIYCSPNAPSDAELSAFRSEYNIDSFLEINYWLRTSNNKAYYKSQNSGEWNSYNLSQSSSGVLEENWILLSVTEPPRTYKYSVLYSTVYFQCWFNPKSNGYYEPIGGGNWGLADGTTFFNRSQMVVLLDNFFSILGHTHTVSDITDMNYPVTINDVQGLSNALTDIELNFDALRVGKADKTWETLYAGSMGYVKTDGNLVSVRLKTGSTAISATDWTTMASLSRLGDGIPSQYYPKSNIYSPYLNGISIVLNTNGELKANRPNGQVNGSVEINVVYPVW